MDMLLSTFFTFDGLSHHPDADCNADSLQLNSLRKLNIWLEIQMVRWYLPVGVRCAVRPFGYIGLCFLEVQLDSHKHWPCLCPSLVK